jgi:hypothetical protein
MKKSTYIFVYIASLLTTGVFASPFLLTNIDVLNWIGGVVGVSASFFGIIIIGWKGAIGFLGKR